MGQGQMGEGQMFIGRTLKKPEDKTGSGHKFAFIISSPHSSVTHLPDQGHRMPEVKQLPYDLVPGMDSGGKTAGVG